MTPLKPIENMTKVRGVPSKRYPPAKVCSHPECSKDAESNHHIFGRVPGPDSDSWFVQIPMIPMHGQPDDEVGVIPHVAGLCGSGTTEHHGDVEEHRAWIRYEDGEFVWYERTDDLVGSTDDVLLGFDWKRIGPLNPQPGEPAAPRKRPKRDPNAGPVKVVSFKAPDDDPEAAQRIKEKSSEILERFTKAGHKIGKTVALERALDYVLINAGPEDF